MNKFLPFSYFFQNNKRGLALTTSQNFFEQFINFDQSTIKIYFDNVIKNQDILCVNDSKQFFHSFLKLFDLEFLESIKIVDIKAFQVFVQGKLNVDLHKEDILNLEILKTLAQIEKIKEVQCLSNYEYVPLSHIEVFLKKDYEICSYYLDLYNRRQIQINNRYFDFVGFILYLSNLENNKLIKKNNEEIVPTYHYDRVSTGRLINDYPEPFQTKSFEYFKENYKSRFENGKFILADYSTIDIRIALALSKTIVKDKTFIDPYSIIAKNILKKNDITEDEREKFKQTVLQILYSENHTGQEIEKIRSLYPKIFTLKEEIIKFVKEKKFVLSYFGSFRKFNDDSRVTQYFHSYIAMTTSDICKKAIIELQKEFKKRKFSSLPIPYVVYDSFLIDYNTSENLDEILDTIRTALVDNTIPNTFKDFLNFSVKIKMDDFKKEL